MDLENKYRLRVETCIGTIIDLHKSISSAGEGWEVFSRFYRLRKVIDSMDMNGVSEGDVLMVEQATNAFLEEFRSIFKSGHYGFVYEKTLH